MSNIDIKYNKFSNFIIANTDICNAPILSNPFNTVYILVDGIIKPCTINESVGQLPEPFNLNTTTIGSIITAFIYGTFNFKYLFSAIRDSRAAADTIPEYDFGTIPCYIKLTDKQSNKIRVIVPYFEIINNLAPVVGKYGYATAFVKLNICSDYAVIDSNTGRPINITKTVPKLIVDRTGTILSVDEVPSSNCDKYPINIPLSIQLFLFRTDNLPGIFPAGQYLVTIVIPTDYNEISTQYIVIYDINKRKIILQLGQPSFIADFIPSITDGYKYWTMDYTPAFLGTNLQIFEDLVL